jgi:hypothetical protein
MFRYIDSILIEKDICDVETYKLSFRVFVCAFHPEITSFFVKNFFFLLLFL